MPRAFAAILQPGIDAGVFRPMNPLGAYFTMIAPILMFVSSTPVRKKLSSRQLVAPPGAPLTTDVFLADLRRSLQRAFAAAPPE